MNDGKINSEIGPDGLGKRPLVKRLDGETFGLVLESLGEWVVVREKDFNKAAQLGANLGGVLGWRSLYKSDVGSK